MKAQKLHEGIDIIQLVIKAGDGISFAKKWNVFLTQCLREQDVNKLLHVRKRLQIGMSKIADDGMNTAKVSKLFLRTQKSIEDTVRKIIKKKDPNMSNLAIDKLLKDSSY